MAISQIFIQVTVVESCNFSTTILEKLEIGRLVPVSRHPKKPPGFFFLGEVNQAWEGQVLRPVGCLLPEHRIGAVCGKLMQIFKVSFGCHIKEPGGWP